MKTLPIMARAHIMRLGLLLSLFIGGPVWATPECPIVTARFPQANGTTADNSATGWYLDASKVSSTGYFAVKSNRLHAQELGGEGIWYSKVFSTAGYTDWQVAVKVSSEGDMNSSEYVRIYYKINGGAEILLDQRTGNFGTIDFTSPLLNGNTVQLVVKIYNYNNGGSQTSKYYIEEYRVFKEKGACAGTVPVSVTAGNGGVLTCANSSITLSASSSASNVTYSWTGPNNFTSTSQNPTVSTAGVYTVTGTNSSGSGSATVTVTENKTIPDLSATGGTLACGSSVTLNASSSVSGAQYSWAGPGGYTSTTQNPTVSTAGTYTVTVRNPANGCVNSKSVEVKAGTAAAADVWVEDFSLSNGTTVDNGTTTWSVKAVSGSTFSVSGNEFKISGVGTSGEGVWTSGAVNIAGKTNVSISVNTRSAVSSGAEMNDSGTYVDYIRFYYKLNGGSEVLFAEKKSAINNHSTSNTTVSVAGLSGSNIQIIVKARASGSDEFYYFDNVKITAVDAAVTLTTTVSGPVTCASNAQITVSPSGSVSSYAWTGPNGFTSATQNPVVSAGGQYIVTATLPSGCTVTAPVTVTENKTPPDVTATGGAMACMTSVTLNAGSSVPNVTYSWTGPNNFTSTSKNPSVTATGTYTVTARDPANGCTASASVQVSGGTSAPAAFWLEDFTLANGTTVDNGSTAWSLESTGAGTVSVQNNEFKVTYDAAAEAKWSSGVIDISGKSDVVISADLRSETPGSNDLFEDDDYISVYYKLNGGAEVLVYNDVAGIGTSTSGTARTSIASAALNGNTIQVIVRARNSNSTERYYFDNVKLTGADKATGSVTATASVRDTLTCARTTVNLSGASNASGVTYSWNGPGNFTSSAQNPAVTTAGNYILTVSTAAGCTAKDTVAVIANTTVPTASAGVSGPLSCATSTVTLSASSETAGVTYGWTGPNGFTSAQQSPVVSVAGTYTLTVTDPVNGCKNTATTTVTSLGSTVATLWLEDFTLGNGTTVDNGSTAWSVQGPSGATFAVSNNEFKISNQGTTGESVWTSGVIDISGKTGVGISANARSAVTGGAVMNESGVYADYLRFYYKLNGGSEVLYAERKSDINGNSSTYTYVSVAGLSGNSLQLVIRARATGNDEFYYVDNVKVTGTPSGTLTASAAVRDTLTCARPSVTLTGSSNTSDVTYSWSGPGNFTSSAQNPAVTAAGDYILTVTNTSTGCTAKDTVTVIQNNFSPGATAEVSGPLTCASPTVVLTGNSATSNVTYSWSGPGNFSSALQNPGVNITGTYTLTVRNTANGCTSTASVTVQQSIDKPNLSVTQPAALTCTSTSVSLTAASSTANTTLTWSGFSAGQNPVSVNAPGKYYVTATAANGCTTRDSVTVTQNIVKPNLSIATPAVLTCNSTSVNLTASSTTANTTFTWTGRTAGQNPISVTAPGKYYVTATTANGCTSIDSVTVIQDITKPNLTIATPAVLTCNTTSVNLTASSTTANTTFTWSGSAAGQNPISVSAAGKYYVTATSANGCTKTDSVTVTQDIVKPNLTIATPAVLTCNTTSVNLTASSATANTTFAWTGNAAGQNPISVSAPGKYYVTATSASGCTKTDSVTVIQDIVKPNLSIATPAVLTCNTTSVNLTASSTTANTSFTWSGSAAGQNPISVSAAGKYYVTATSANGCTKQDSVTVTQDIVKPNLSIATPQILTCNVMSVSLMASSTTSGTTFTWTGNAAGQNPISVSTPGKYYVTATSANGCTKQDSVTVTQDIVKPNLSIATPQVLTCDRASINLTASSTTANTTFTWLGNAAGQNPISVSAAGKYYVTATSANGCIKTDSVTVTQDVNKPNLTIATPQILTCNVMSVSLVASSTTSGTTFTWAGKGAGQNPISVTAPGKYYVTATTTSGCSTIDSVTVIQDIVKPNLTIATPQVLTCNTTSVSLTASSTTANTTFTWTGNAAGQNPISVGTPGKYYVTATSANGCTKQDSVTVTQDIVKPNLAIATPQVLTCNTTSVNLTASSTTANTTFTWSGRTAGQNPISVTAPGKHYVTATAANGCTKQDSVTVTQDIIKPNLSIATPAVLRCNTTSVNLTASSTTANTTFTWTGNAAGQNPISVSAAGKYYVTATSANGCTKQDSVTVTQDIVKPNLSIATPQVLTCNTTSVNLTASSTTANTTFTWTGSAAGQNPISVTAPGKYYVTATAANGCTKQDSVTVIQDIVKPNLSIATPQVLTCNTTSVNLTASSTTANTTFTWTGRTAGQNPISVTAPGKYYVTATAANGCTKQDSVTVTQDIVKPNLTIATPQVLTCNTTSVSLTASSTTANTSFTWTGNAAGQNPISVTAPGKYYVTATSANGCTKQDSVTVTQDIVRPNLTIATPQVLTCNTTSVSLTASSTTANITFTWTGNAAGQNPINVFTPGKYYVTATSANGCTRQDSVTVTQDIVKPNLTIATPQVLTCNTTSVNLTASSTTANTTFTWTGNASGQNPISVSAPGKYYVTATSANGCTKQDSVTVTQDIVKPNLTIATPQVLTCNTTSVNLTASSTTANTTFTWTGNAAGQNPISVSAAGKYYVTATSANGCIKQDSVTVIQDIVKPNLTIATPQVLTCNTTSVNLTASSTTANTTFTWTGRTAGQNPISVSAAGKYYVTATSANGCTKQDSVTVTQDIVKPNLSIATPQVLTCNTISVNLTASSTTANTTFTWTGNAAGQNPISVTAPGKYYVTATSANGCTKQDSVTVTQDIVKPNLSIATPPVLTCNTTSVSLTASSTTANTTFTWTGNAAGQNPISVSAAGKYYVTATSANGCTKQDSVTVVQDINKPNLTITAPQVLTCDLRSVNLTASSTTANTTFTWTGFTAGQNPVSVSTYGKYYVTATAVNGCFKKDSVTVIQNITLPADVQASNDGPLNCTKKTVKIAGNTTTGNVSYAWTGPADFSATTREANVNTKGTYSLRVTNNANGCYVTTSTTVDQNITPPGNVQVSNDGPLTCANDIVTLRGSSGLGGATYQWSGPGNFNESTATVFVTKAGTYTLSVTDPGNGCFVSTKTEVKEDKKLPDAIINAPASMPEPLSDDVLTAQTVVNATYAWTLTSPDGSWQMIDGDKTATLIYQSGNAGVKGTFDLTVTDRGNGCQNTARLVLTATPATTTMAVVPTATTTSASLEYKVYPNPFVDRTLITFKSPVSGKITVEIYNALQGHMEKLLFNQQVRSGETYKLTLDAGALPAGAHFCVIKANGRTYTSKLLLVR